MHPAKRVQEYVPVVYTAHSAKTFFMRHHICLFVLQQGYIPLNPFMNFEYFLLDTVERNKIRQGNNSYIHIVSEVWTFGPIADGVREEVLLAERLGKPVKHFSLKKTLESIKQITRNNLEYEEGVEPLL
ncbi:hypothetical protein FJZ31_09370 [Candidatus Poribacteria bacterium]|nr:hypothetical protein [Candidatus Poribacteria bacterium]